jgi:PAS domain S-box-containing protein
MFSALSSNFSYYSKYAEAQEGSYHFIDFMIFPSPLENLRKGNSLRTDFMLSLLLAMIPAFLISLSFDYYFVYTQNMKALREISENKVIKAVHTLQKPLWHYDTDFLHSYVEILADDSSLTRIFVYDDRDRPVAQFDTSALQENLRSVSWEIEKPILQEGVIIGRLLVTFNNSEISKLTRQMIVSDILVILAVLCSVWSVSWILINRYVLHPLKIMKNSFHSISEGDYSKRVLLEDNNELTSIAGEFNTMVDQVEMREMALRESEVKYRNLVESPSDIIFTADNDNQLIFINSNYEKWTGIPAEFLLGRPFSELFPKFHEIGDLLSNARYTGSSKVLFEEELKKKDGSSIPVELNFSTQYDSNDTAIGVIGIARDISNRRQAEGDLRKYEQMVASITDYMLLIDRNFIIQAVNNAYLENAGKERHELIGAHITTIYNRDVFAEDFLPFLEACLEGNSVKNDLLMAVDDGKSKYMTITYYPIFEQDNSVSGVMMHQRDVTEQKRLEAMLHQSQKMEAIGTLAGGIAHDFNNIIGGIVGYAEMIEMFDAENSPRLQSRIQHVLKGAYRAKDLVEQILTFSRNTDSKKKPLNLGELVKDTMQFLRASIPSTIEIINQEIHDNAVVWADETSLHQILMNLCTNGAHAMQKEGGHLVVSLTLHTISQADADNINVTDAGAYVVLSVSDTGIGIDSTTITRIFEPFYTTKKTGEGTGMGLAVVHGIVKNLRGAITVESTPALGTTFNVYLPRFDFTAGEAANTPVVENSPAKGKGCILIVDDEQELVKFSAEILEHLGYEVISKTSSVSARKTFMEDPYRFDLVLTDQTMPNITGLDLARQFMEIRSEIRIILCTGFSQPNIEQEANALGISRFVKKPFGARQLANMVQEELDTLHRARKNGIEGS